MITISVDIEADGPAPGEYSMIELGAVYIDPEFKLNQTFYTTLKPISDKYKGGALSVTGHSREDCMMFEDPATAMAEFNTWLLDIQAARSNPYNISFFSDNNGFDWQFVNYYFWRYLDFNPFGFSSQNIGSIYKGLVKNPKKNFKHLRKTKHTHNPVDDAKGNAEALIAFKTQLEYGIIFH